jgi:hypothetical protein
MVNLKFITDGSPKGHKLVVAETGEEIHNVHRVSFEATAGNLAHMEIELTKVPIEITGSDDKARVIRQTLYIDDGVEVNNA